jgi:ATP-dependent helicase HrpB
LLNQPGIPADSIVILDEVHERSADLDTLLALLKLELDKKRDLKLIAMSATLNAEHLEAYFGPHTVRLLSAGKSYPVTVSYAAKPDERPLPVQVRSAIKEAQRLETTAAAGDVLVFLPGAQEIRECAQALAAVPGFVVQTLHGDLPLSEQAQVVSETQAGRRIVLSTNVAESSLTIPGVTLVIDSGLARNAEFDPWAGITRLHTQPISQARAMQRVGRAGRVQPGHAIRLYTHGQFTARPEQDTPELLRTDLSELLLKLLAHHARGGPALEEYRFLDEPPPQAFTQARQLLTLLGAMDLRGVTALGIAMSALPLAPRLGKIVASAHAQGILAHGCLAAALLSERDVLLSTRRPYEHAQVIATDSDLDERIDRVVQAVSARFDRHLGRDLDLDLQTARSVDQIARNLYKHARGLFPDSKRGAADLYRQLEAEAQLGRPLARVLLHGFIDRVAAARESGREFVLQTGTQAALSPHSGVTAPYLLALSMDAPGGRARKPIIRIAARIDPDWLLELDESLLVASVDFSFEPSRERVECVSRLCFGKIVLDESRREAPPGPQAQKVLVDALLARGGNSFDPEGKLASARARLVVLIDACPELLLVHDEATQAHIRQVAYDHAAVVKLALMSLASGATSLKQLQEQDLSQAFAQALPHDLNRHLERETPLTVRLKGGLTVSVNYEQDKAPWIEARLQNFFSMQDTPRICAGRLPVQLHLLAPNHRPVQVTSDLAGFWQRHYPELRKQLMRRYPKHLWPEDGRTAQPPTPGKIR